MIEDLGRQPQMSCDDGRDGTVTTARAKGKPSDEKCVALGGCRLASQAITCWVEWLGIGDGVVRRWLVAALVGVLAPAGFDNGPTSACPYFPRGGGGVFK
ncbi:hypothetical protein QBC32DRAFT_335270 [Pseudoneurospora amorphoporcata]|uniref:Uncharacterized protein n=1 Tax=Pseudoneurospora amorphoporcata TaxID=241081 RepID=A0AAN6NZD2_9PEZI|nr:hypothetical protein QBC32DRAFT_335270 [Pseudoneurospora amorphoporcata]